MTGIERFAAFIRAVTFGVFRLGQPPCFHHGGTVDSHAPNGGVAPAFLAVKPISRYSSDDLLRIGLSTGWFHHVNLALSRPRRLVPVRLQLIVGCHAISTAHVNRLFGRAAPLLRTVAFRILSLLNPAKLSDALANRARHLCRRGLLADNPAEQRRRLEVRHGLGHRYARQSLNPAQCFAADTHKCSPILTLRPYVAAFNLQSLVFRL